MHRIVRQSIFATLLSLHWLLSLVCQAEPLTGHFVVEHKQKNQSLSIKRDLNSLPGSPSDIVDTDGSAGSSLPPDDKTQKLGGYGLKMTFIESISWQLHWAVYMLFTYGLFWIIKDAAQDGGPYWWIFAEGIVAVGWLLEKNYWNTVSPNSMDKPEASQNDSFAITTMMLSGQGQKQNDKPNQSSASSGQQASGATTHLTGSITGPLSSGSGGGNEGPEQHDRHTLDINCYIDFCHGVCKLRPSSDSTEPAEGALHSSETSTDHAAGTTEQGLPFPRENDLGQTLGDSEKSVHRSSIETDPGNGCKNTYPLAAVAVGELTCDLKVFGADARKRSCGMVCKGSKAVRYHIEKHKERRECFLNRIDMMKMRIRMRRASLYPGQHPCDERVAGTDGEEQRCGVVLDNPQSLWCHKLRFHTGPQICEEQEFWEDGLPHTCGQSCENALELVRHKKRFHEPRKCHEIVVCENGHLHPCGIVCVNLREYFCHLSIHRETEPVGTQ